MHSRAAFQATLWFKNKTKRNKISWKIQKGSEPRNRGCLLQSKTTCTPAHSTTGLVQAELDNKPCRDASHSPSPGVTFINPTRRHTSGNKSLKTLKTHAMPCRLLSLSESNDICPSVFTVTHHPGGFAVRVFSFACLLIFFPYFNCSASSTWSLLSEDLVSSFTPFYFTALSFLLLSFPHGDICHSEGPAWCHPGP